MLKIISKFNFNNLKFQIYIIGVLSFIKGLSLWGASFSNPFIFNDDVRHNLFWMAQWSDKALFQNDLLTHFSKEFLPAGYKFLFYFIHFIVDPIQAANVVGLMCYVLTAIIITMIGFEIKKDSSVGFLSALTFITSYGFYLSFSGGNPRAFALLLVFTFTYFLLKKNFKALSLIFFIQILFYPISWLICVVQLSLFWLKTYKFDFKTHKKTLSLLLISILASFLIYVVPNKLNPSLNQLVTHKDMVGHQEYYEGGRYHLLPISHVDMHDLWNEIDFARSARSLVSDSNIFPFLILCFIYLFFRKRIRMRQEITSLLQAGTILFLLAMLTLLHLYVPSKYIYYGVRPALLLLSIFTFDYFASKYRTWIKNSLIIGLSLFLLLGNDYKKGMIDLSSSKRIFTFIHSLPDNSLLAGYPSGVIDSVPLLSQRKALVTYELSNVMYKHYRKEIFTRTYDLFNAYFAADRQTIIDFSKKYDIDYLIVDKNLFGQVQNAEDVYFEPFNTYLHTKYSGQTNFHLQTLEPLAIYKDKNRFILDMQALK